MNLDNWKYIQVLHPKRNTWVKIKDLSNNEKGKIIVSLSKDLAQSQSNFNRIQQYANFLVADYGNYRASIDALSLVELQELGRT